MEVSGGTEVHRTMAELIESAGVNAQAGPIPSISAIE